MKIERSVGEQLKLNSAGECEKARICYVASGVTAEEIDSAVSQVFELAPEQWENIPKESVEILRSPGGGMVEIAVNYRMEESAGRKKYTGKANGDREWRAEVITRLQPVKNAIRKIASFDADPGAAPDPGTLLHWNGIHGVGSVSGSVSVYRPEFSITCIATFTAKKAQNNSYLRKIAALAGKVNSETFNRWAAGELLFLGLSTSSFFKGKNGEDLCDMTFRFGVRCNGSRSLDGITIQKVEGWDYLWGIYNRARNDNKLTSAHVSQIYERAPFSVLDI